MQIFGPFRVSTTQASGGVQRLQPHAASAASSPPRSAAAGSAGPVDQLDLSGASRLEASGVTAPLGGATASASGSAASSISEMRIDRVADLRRQIASGNYDTAEKLDIALERMLDRLG